jgi:heme/copper-type cytochrome/quinol oxidase subunit 2
VGGIGIVLGVLLLGFNLRWFPVPPAESESIDWGPFVALWMMAVFVLLVRQARSARA